MSTPHFMLAALTLLFGVCFVADQPFRPPDVPGQVTVTYWEKWTGFEGEAMRNTIDLFNSKKIRNAKGEVIQCRYMSASQVDRKSILAIAAGTPPDIAGFWSYNLHAFADMGALRPLDDLIARDNFDLDRYIPVFIEMGQHRGKQWCLPSTPATTALFWNKDMFRQAGLDPEKPPVTIAELDAMAKTLTKIDTRTGKMIQLGFIPAEPGWWHWAWGYFFGGKLVGDDGRLTVDDPKNIAAFRWVTRFAALYGREKLLAFKQGIGAFDSPQNAFMAGRVAMVLQGVWMANFIRFHNPHLEYGCAPMPCAFDTHGQPVTIADLDVLTIPRGARHVDEAWEVIKFVNSREGSEFLCGGRDNNGGQGKLTPFKEVSPLWLAQHPNPQLRVFIDQAFSKNAVYTPKLPLWDEFRIEMNAAFERVWLGDGTPEETLKHLQIRMQSKLDRMMAVRKLREDAERRDAAMRGENAGD
jgi:multiple sugar transport system substrate-binding protein